jgi:hypothetical protein
MTSLSRASASFGTGSREFLARPSPRLPQRDGVRPFSVFGGTSALIHAIVVTGLLSLAGASAVRPANVSSPPQVRRVPEQPRLVFLGADLESDMDRQAGRAATCIGPAAV